MRDSIDQFFKEIQLSFSSKYNEALGLCGVSTPVKKHSDLPASRLIKILDCFNVSLYSVVKGKVDYDVVERQMRGEVAIPSKYLEGALYSLKSTPLKLVSCISNTLSKEAADEVLKTTQIRGLESDLAPEKVNLILLHDICEYVSAFYGDERVAYLGAQKALNTISMKMGNWNGKIKKFELKFKSKHQITQETFHCNKKALKINLRLFSSRIAQPLRVRNKMKRWWDKNVNNINHDFKIIKEKPDKYYIILTTTRKKVQKTDRKKVVSLDPGVRTFQTFYDTEGSSGKIGDLESLKLMKKAKKLDLLISLRKKIKEIRKRTRQNMKKRCYELRTKVRNIVKDLHWKTCHFLCENYETILLPDFKVSNMIERCPKRLRKINNEVVRRLLCLSHYSFKERLKHLVNCYSGTRLIIVNESYTTKTCGNCGLIKEIGGNKKYNCPSCYSIIDRDINGSRNILLRYMTKHGLDSTR